MNKIINENKYEILITLVLVLFSVLFLNPYWMPMGYVSIGVLVFLVFLGLFINLVWKESPADEREFLLMNISGRIAYLVGIFVLAIGISFEIYKDMHVDFWLILAFLAMIFVKIIGFLRSR